MEGMTDGSTRSWLPRFSLRQLLLATTFAAVGCYALRWASPWWSIVLFYTVLALVVGGLLVAINWPGEARSFWLGFAIIALMHWLLVFRPGLENGIPAIFPNAFVTHWLSAYTYTLIKPQLTVTPIQTPEAELRTTRGRFAGEHQEISGQPSGRGFFPQAPTLHAGEDGYFRGLGPGPFYIHQEDFVQVALGLWTLLLAYVGGHVSLMLYRWRMREKVPA
jgi:hypothetical protein